MTPAAPTMGSISPMRCAARPASSEPTNVASVPTLIMLPAAAGGNPAARSASGSMKLAP